MPRTCTVCSHGDRPTINAALVAGEPIPAVSARFELSESALKRHRAGHLPLALVKAAEAAEVAEADALLDQVKSALRRARGYEVEAATAGDVRGALLALREERATLELLARMSGELEGPPQEPLPTLLYRWVCEHCGKDGDPFPDPPPIPDHANGNGGST